MPAKGQEPQRSTQTVAREALRSVVLVVASDASGEQSKQGSGFLVSEDGKLVTNFHVVAGMTSAVVKFQDGAHYVVEGSVAVDAKKDIAILKLRSSDRKFIYLPLGDSDHLQVGEPIVTIGSPLSLEATVSEGIVSALRSGADVGQELSPDLKLLQITAPISPGSSGGALLNLSGEVVGITSFAFSKGQNLNFAVPINYAKPLIGEQGVVSLAHLSIADDGLRSGTIADVAGAYVGVWQSRLSGSGALVLTMSVEGQIAKGIVVVTGSPSGYKGDSLVVTKQTNMGKNIWVVEMKGEKSRLSATGVFKEGTFVGDFSYKYSNWRPPDRGQWVLKK